MLAIVFELLSVRASSVLWACSGRLVEDAIVEVTAEVMIEAMVEVTVEETVEATDEGMVEETDLPAV